MWRNRSHAPSYDPCALRPDARRLRRERGRAQRSRRPASRGAGMERARRLDGADASEVMIYGGTSNLGRHVAYEIKEKSIRQVKCDDKASKVKVYLGHLDRKDWYGHDFNDKPIDSLTHDMLTGKIVYFIKAIEG